MEKLPQVKLAIIGGSGLDKLEGLEIIKVIKPEDLKGPFGQPAGPVTIGKIGGKKVAFLCRHGLGHLINPTNVPHRANIWALVLLGVRKIFAVSACGSLTEEIQPGVLTVPDQLMNHTFLRPRTFFDRNGLVVHISVAEPFCEQTRQEIILSLQQVDSEHYDSGTYITIEGPQFSTNAEHNTYIRWGCHLIGMTTSPEAQLAREAGMCYAGLAMPTDIYTGKGKHKPVTADIVVKTFMANIGNVIKVLPLIIDAATVKDCGCQHATESGIQSDQSLMPASEQAILNTLLRKNIPTAAVAEESKGVPAQVTE